MKIISSDKTSDRLPLTEQIRRGEVLDPNCPSREILRHITSRWGLLILLALSDQTLRFSELRRKVGGVSEKMLAQTLQSLEEDGFIDRRSFPVVPPHVEYSLTPLGIEVKDQVSGLANWLESNLHRVLKQRSLRVVGEND
ncbi:transcriptional regulator [Rahnella sp. AA]|uniref:winged helix-turn-helix transcriptional regulator n=1 Tax=Rahnella sp. AA TaxID=2057180 RepID=UPI000C32E4E6|nr:helix-turn-helix domain-containing protein [Rahnella sp. AA]PKE28493.1 transcriptional regulator [Rahnella sp. AA]